MLRRCNYLCFGASEMASDWTLRSSACRSFATWMYMSANAGFLLEFCARLLEAIAICIAPLRYAFSASVNILVLLLLCGCARLDITTDGMSLSSGFGRKMLNNSQCFQNPLDQPVESTLDNRPRRPMVNH